MDIKLFLDIVEVLKREYADEINWQESLKPCDNAETFRDETIWVILNSGMKEQIARLIWNRIKDSWFQGNKAHDVFKHAGKCDAIELVKLHCEKLFSDYLASTDKIEYLQTIPFIGKITKFHLAKNLGHDCVKPDRHLVRIASQYGTTPEQLCETLHIQSGYKKCTVDIILWRSANLKMI